MLASIENGSTNAWTSHLRIQRHSLCRADRRTRPAGYRERVRERDRERQVESDLPRAERPTWSADILRRSATVQRYPDGPHTILTRHRATLDLRDLRRREHGRAAATLTTARRGVAQADHGVPLTDNTGRKFARAWPTHDRFLSNTCAIRSSTRRSSTRIAIVAEPAEPARLRHEDSRVESSAMSRVVANYAKVVTCDVHDRPTNRC